MEKTIWRSRSKPLQTAVYQSSPQFTLLRQKWRLDISTSLKNKGNTMRKHTFLSLLTPLIGLGLCAAGSANASETTADKIARAMSAAPPSVSAQATIMDVDGTVLRKGDNGWICFPGVGLVPGDKHPMCNDKVWMAWMDAAKNGTSFSTDVIGVSYMLQGDALVNNDDPTATDPNDGGMWIQEGPHLMLLLPKTLLKGLPRTPKAAGPYVMWGDTPLEHIMVPIAPPIE
tara:strand:- start:7227 stop:7913 length:687 start_codon:yes stop_codon:yes gene_type:complete